ncbi:uncharacterized protein N7529_009430 [Penicillium soppii]|uniref:uncharacterized protein n=1 Tax=Penicillium soppii TaxID=69789 RepID=UPI0025477F18|nr:uncharacterized protein N7529_009430 [Penicillium soppii]KAJ5855486.1 hypothetical protein N7529_009430 [Penicillium soppii]
MEEADPCMDLYQVPSFVGREEELGEIDRAVDGNKNTMGSAVVILGMGGLGKTQLVHEYCRRSLESGKFQATFWLDASSRESLLSSYEKIASRMTLPGTSSEQAELVDRVKNEISGLDIPWVAVLDNFDFPSRIPDIGAFIPMVPAQLGTVLVTSRHRGVTCSKGTTILLNQMTQQEALDLFFQRLGYERTEASQAQAITILGRFGSLPLAIEQTTTFIKTRQLYLATFLDQYKTFSRDEMWTSVPSWWWDRNTHQRAGSNVYFSVRTTFELSLQETEKVVSGCEDILSFFAFFHSSKLSDEMGVAAVDAADGQMEHLSWAQSCLTDGLWDSSKFRDMLYSLRAISLVQEFEDSSGFVCLSLHPVIREWLQMRLGASRRSMFLKAAIDALTALLRKQFKNMDVLPFSRRQWLLAHIETLIEHTNETISQELSYDSVDTMLMFAAFLVKFERYELAERLYCQALAAAREENHEPSYSNPRVAYIYDQLGGCFFDQVKYPEARDMFLQAIKTKTSTQGKNDPSVLKSMKQLGTVYRRMGLHAASARLLEYVVKRMWELNGSNDTQYLQAASNLAALYFDQGHFQKAMELVQQILNAKLENWGECNSTCATMRSLALIKLEIGDDIEAESLLLRALFGQERFLGPMHASTLYTVDLLENLYVRLKNEEGAKKMRAKSQGEVGSGILRSSRYGTIEI